MEIWKDITGYEWYQVSNQWNIRTIDRVVKCWYWKTRVSKWKMLILMDHNKWYMQVTLYANKIRKLCTIHRLVAKEFIENVFSFKTVNHKNGIKSDNRVENLEWCTQSENCKHAYRTWLSKITENNHFKTNHPLKKKAGNEQPLIQLLSKINEK